MSKLCPLCRRRAESSTDFCERHKRAELNVKAGYDVWAKALDKQISIRSYLERIINLSETGQAAREVAGYLLKK